MASGLTTGMPLRPCYDKSKVLKHEVGARVQSGERCSISALRCRTERLFLYFVVKPCKMLVKLYRAGIAILGLHIVMRIVESFT